MATPSPSPSNSGVQSYPVVVKTERGVTPPLNGQERPGTPTNGMHPMQLLYFARRDLNQNAPPPDNQRLRLIESSLGGSDRSMPKEGFPHPPVHNSPYPPGPLVYAVDPGNYTVRNSEDGMRNPHPPPPPRAIVIANPNMQYQPQTFYSGGNPPPSEPMKTFPVAVDSPFHVTVAGVDMTNFQNKTGESQELLDDDSSDDMEDEEKGKTNLNNKSKNRTIKRRFLWNKGLHGLFVEAYSGLETLGVTPTPKKVMNAMRELQAPMEGLTRVRVASHFQKYQKKSRKDRGLPEINTKVQKKDKKSEPAPPKGKPEIKNNNNTNVHLVTDSKGSTGYFYGPSNGNFAASSAPQNNPPSAPLPKTTITNLNPNSTININSGQMEGAPLPNLIIEKRNKTGKKANGNPTSSEIENFLNYGL